MKTPSSIQIAHEIVKLGAKQNPPRFFTPMQLLKLVYISHGWMLALYGRPLISDPVEAWMYGPVIPKLYNKIKSYRDQPVKAEALEGSFGSSRAELDKYEEHMIAEAVKKYGHLSGPALSRITHARGTPWSLTYDKTKTKIISNDMIADHYQLLMLGRDVDASAAQTA